MQLDAGTKLQGGKYEIIRTIGQGGFGITYEALQASLDRKVAIKEFFMKDCCERGEDASRVTVPTGSNRELVEKFRGKFIREAKMIAGFSHAHIVRILDVFEENDTAYYVMEELTGGSLKALVDKNGPLSEPVAEKYIRELASALDYVHKHDTLHLDVKPANVLLNSEGDAVLIDFGISKHYDKSGEQTSSTPVGISKGYAPLEQGRDGDVKQFGPSTDIYALGATLYHLLSGQVPPEASIVAEDGLERPDSISDRMWRVVSGAMAPFRKNRPQSISAFLSLFEGEAPQKAVAEDETIIEKPKPKPTPKSVSKPAAKPTPKPVSKPVSKPISKSAAKPASKPATPKSVQTPKKNWPWVLGAAVVSVIVVILMSSGPNMKYRREARQKQNEYLALVSACETNIANGNKAEYKMLLEAKALLSEILDYELSYDSYYPKVYNEYFRLKSELSSKLEEAGNAWANAASSQKRIGNVDNAIDYYHLAYQLYPEGEASQEYEKLARSKAYMKIHDVVFGNYGNDEMIDDFGSTLHANTLKFLKPKILYDGLWPSGKDSIDLYIKIIDPDGHMRHSSSSPSGYTYDDTNRTVYSGDDNSMRLAGWGNETSLCYSPGTYRFEIWFEGNKLFTKKFTIY